MAEAAGYSSDTRKEETTEQRIKETTSKPLETSTQAKPTVKRNAFSELMSSKPFKTAKANSSVASTPIPTPTQLHSGSTSGFYTRHSNLPKGDARSGLLSYIENPESKFPPGTILHTTDHTVLIRDLYPKATIHLLLLPRSPAHYNLHPHDAFQDSAFLDIMKQEASIAASLAANELSRLISPHSATSSARNEAINSSNPPTTLPAGRDFSNDIRIGVHAHPSMSHLHIHIISRDMHSSSLKHRKHYNSFNTDFFIPLADYPLAGNDQRRSVSYQNANLKQDFVCWHCGQKFGNKFVKLKAHLEDEFKAWRAA